MAFPADQDIELSFSAAFGADLTVAPTTWDFTDLSARVIDTPITIIPGVLVGTGGSKTGSVTGLTLLNDDGYLTPFLAASPWYPYVDAGTPAQLQIRTDTSIWLSDTFSRTVGSGWGTAPSGAVWTASSVCSVSGGKGIVSIPTVNTVTTPTTPFTHRDIDVRWDMSIAAVSTGASNVVGPVLRRNAAGADYIWAGLEFDVAGTMKWTIRTYEASVGTIRQQTTVTGLTYSAGTTVSAHVELVGERLRAQAWLTSGDEPTTWTIDVDLPVLLGADDYVGMKTWVVSGNTNTLPNPVSVDNLVVQQPRYARFEGYLADVQPSFRVLADGTEHSVVQVKLGGVGSRLEKQEAPAWSPLRRSLQLASSPPSDLWMLEDKAGATSAASAFDGRPSMTVTGPAVFAFDVGVPDDLFVSRFGVTALCSVAAGARLSAPLTVADTGQWTASMMVDETTSLIGGGITEVRLMEWTTPGSAINRWALVRTMTAWQVRAYDDTAGTVTTVATSTGTIGSGLGMLEAAAVQNGGNIDVTLYIVANVLGTGSIAGTLAAPAFVRVNPDQVNTTASTSPYGIRFVVGAIGFHAAAGPTLPYYADGTLGVTPRADRAWCYEASHRRAARLSDEESVPFRLVGDPYASGVTQLNAQQPGGYQALMTSAVDAQSGGILAEGRFGYQLTERTQRYNAAVDLTVDMATYCYSDGNPDDVLVPKLDARGPNYWTVQRTGGSSATFAAPLAYRLRRGTIAQSATLDVLLDADCGPHAGWRTHLSVDGQGANYPQTPLDLAANPALIPDWLICRIGSRLQRTNQPSIAGVGVIDQVMDGWTETIARRAWSVNLDTSPAQVWQVGVWDAGNWDSGSTTLAEDVTDSGTLLKLSVADATDTWWTDGTGYGIVCAGQTNTVRWMSQAGSVSTLEGGFETGLTGWTAAGGSAVQSSAQAHVGTYSAQLTVSGSPGTASLSPTTAMPVDPNVSYTATAWVYATSTVNNVRISISWYTGAGTFISSTLGSTISLGAGVWTQITVQGTSPGTAALARHAPQIFSSPANGTQMWIDDVDMVRDAGSLTGAGPYVQRAWVTRGTDVVKTLPAGAEVHVADPVVLAL